MGIATVNSSIILSITTSLVFAISCDSDDPRRDTSKNTGANANDDVGEDELSEKCDEIIDVVVSCYDDFCAEEGVDTAFCGCWNQDMDIETASCECVPQNVEMVCDVIDLDDVDPADYDCVAATDVVASLCR